MAIGTLALCYDNIEVFRGVVKMRRGKKIISAAPLFQYQNHKGLKILNLLSCFSSFSGLTAKVIDRTKTMADVYGAFYDFSCMMKPKVRFLNYRI